MQTIQVFKVAKIKEAIPVRKVKFINPSQVLNSLGCSACKRPIGKARPIAIAWTDEGTMRLCNACSSHLVEEQE